MLKRSLAVLLFVSLAVSAFAVQAKTTVKVEGTNAMRFSVEKITVSPGEKVTLTLVNNTKLPAAAMSHNWILLKKSADPEAVDQAALKAKANGYVPKSKADQIIAHTGLVAGGESDTITFTAPTEPGKYVYICTFPGHFAAGMKGVLIVKG